MTRLTCIAAACAAVALVAPGGLSPAWAQSQAELAAQLNEEGKVLMYSNKYAEASAKFQQAIARVPEAKYFFNLCTSRFQEGKFGEAMTACEAVAQNRPSDEQRAKTDKLIQRIRDEAKAQGIDNVQSVGGGGVDPGPGTVDCAANPSDPKCAAPPPPPDICQTNPQAPECQQARPPNPPPPQNQFVGKPPSQGLFTSTTPDNKYTWTLGVDLFGGGGQVGRKDFYGTTSRGIRFKGDYLLDAGSRVGTQAYLQITQFSKGDEQMGFMVDSLDIFDVGISVYKHICPRGTQRLCLTPLAGVQIAMMSPNKESDGAGSQVFNYAALGGRLELGAQYAFGGRFEHVLGLMLGVNIYSPVFSGPEDSLEPGMSIEDVALDKGGAAAYVGVGYTYRFNTPLGRSPFVTLE